MTNVRITKVTIIKLCDECGTEHQEPTECSTVPTEVGWIEEFDCD